MCPSPLRIFKVLTLLCCFILDAPKIGFPDRRLDFLMNAVDPPELGDTPHHFVSATNIMACCSSADRCSFKRSLGRGLLLRAASSHSLSHTRSSKRVRFGSIAQGGWGEGGHRQNGRILEAGLHPGRHACATVQRVADVSAQPHRTMCAWRHDGRCRRLLDRTLIMGTHGRADETGPCVDHVLPLFSS